MSDNLDSIINDLKTTYNILNVVDISEVLIREEKWLHDIILKQFKSEYKDHDRIVFYFNNEEHYQYENFPGQAIQVFQKLLHSNSISNYFVILISNHANGTQELDQVREQYTTESISVKHFYLPSDIRFIADYKKESFCVLPWIEAYIDEGGYVAPCCHIDKKNSYGNVKKQELTKLINNVPAQKLRQDMIDGIRNQACWYCHQVEDANQLSTRHSANIKFKETVDKLKNKESAIIESIKILELSIDNTCNFKCRTCGGNHSSAIALEEKIIYNDSSNLKLSLTKFEKKEFLEKVIPLIDNLIELSFCGGEPLLQKYHYQLLEYLIEKNKTSITLNYLTNFSNLDYNNYLPISLWKKFNSVNLQLSLDGEGARAEYIRHGTVWNKILEYYQLLRKECPHVNIGVSSTISILSIFTVVDLQRNWISQGLINSDQLYMSLLYGPKNMSIQVLPKIYKNQVRTYIINHQEFLKISGYTKLADRWNPIMVHMDMADHSHLLTDFFQNLKVLDTYRNENFEKTFPEYSELYKYQ